MGVLKDDPGHQIVMGAATDHPARVKFRRYWSLFSHGIILIRWALLRPVKADAERRARAA